MQNQDYSELGLVCPSFNSYTSDRTADTADKVCREFNSLGLVDESREYEDQQDDDFEFVSFQKSTDQVFFGDNTRIGPVFPVFNRDLLLHKSQPDLNDADEAAPSSSSASSDVDELEGVPAGSYCVWMPKTTPASSPSQCKKSKSTGTSSSRRWRLRDLLRRSNSEGGKDAFVLLTPALTSSSSKKQVAAAADDNHHHHHHEKVIVTKGKKSFDGPRPKGPNAVSMAHELFYAKSKDKDGYNKRQSYLPYRKDLIGFFASVNAMGRTFPAF